MRRIILLLGLSLLFSLSAAAQDQAAPPPPKVLVIVRENLKPGKAGTLHEKSESAFVNAFKAAKWPQHYFAADSQSGAPRTLFFVGYDSFAAWEKDEMAQQNNAALSAALDRAGLADGDLLSETDAGVFTFNEDQSQGIPVDIAHMRYFEISLYRVRPGHRKEWEAIVKLVKAAYEKIPDVHWAVFASAYGGEDVTYLVFIPLKSASEIDKSMLNDKQFVENMGEEGMKKLSELESSAVEFTQTNLFMFNPAMSYPPDAWVKADPDFWKPKAAGTTKAMPKAKADEKPAAKP